MTREELEDTISLFYSSESETCDAAANTMRVHFEELRAEIARLQAQLAAAKKEV